MNLFISKVGIRRVTLYGNTPLFTGSTLFFNQVLYLISPLENVFYERCTRFKRKNISYAYIHSVIV